VMVAVVTSRKTARQILHHHGRRIGQFRKQVIDSYPETQRLTNAEVRGLAHLNSISSDRQIHSVATRLLSRGLV